MLNTYVALLRGINVGGKNKLPMKDLRALLGGLGLQDVRTYIQSGNVVFCGEEGDRQELAEEIALAVENAFGFRPRVLVLTASQLETAVKENPFPEAVHEPKTLHLYFLLATPADPDFTLLDGFKKESERYALLSDVFYLHAPEGIGRSKMAERVEKALGVPATARNWRSVGKLMDLVNDNEKEA